MTNKQTSNIPKFTLDKTKTKREVAGKVVLPLSDVRLAKQNLSDLLESALKELKTVTKIRGTLNLYS